MKRKISFALALLLLATLFGGCKKDTVEENAEGGKVDIPDKHIPLEGDVKSVWFDELFAAYYPAQLDGSVEIIFSKAYVYGDEQTKQPVMCLCSDTITDVSLFKIADGVKTESLYVVDKLEPMEVIWIFPELGVQGAPNIGISFSDKEGNSYSYTLSRNEEGSEVIIEAFEG